MKITFLFAALVAIVTASSSAASERLLDGKWHVVNEEGQCGAEFYQGAAMLVVSYNSRNDEMILMVADGDPNISSWKHGEVLPVKFGFFNQPAAAVGFEIPVHAFNSPDGLRGFFTRVPGLILMDNLSNYDTFVTLQGEDVIEAFNVKGAKAAMKRLMKCQMHQDSLREKTGR